MQPTKFEADVEVARNEADTAKRDAQVAKIEIERLSAETAKLNAALERLETEKTAIEGKARAMEFVVYGAIIILIALLAIISSILLVNRRRAIAAKAEGIGPATKPSEVAEDIPVVETSRASGGGDSHLATASDTSSFSPDLARPVSSDATAPKRQDGNGASDGRSSSETAEERVTLPI